MIPNVLAERYASPAITAIWSPEGKIRIERELWIAVMKAQRALGLDIPADAIAAYESAKDMINAARIMERERITRHDVKARIDEFCELAGHEHIHKGMTSRDLTENVEQLQIFRSLQQVMVKSVAVLGALSKRAVETRDLILTARTHNVAAQTTTFGKRLAMFAEELLGGLSALEHLVATYPVRGIKGATGTQLDQINLFGGDTQKVAALEQQIGNNTYCHGGAFGLGDICAGMALGYMDRAYGQYDWRTKFPGLKKYSEPLFARASFQATL